MSQHAPRNDPEAPHRPTPHIPKATCKQSPNTPKHMCTYVYLIICIYLHTYVCMHMVRFRFSTISPDMRVFCPCRRLVRPPLGTVSQKNSSRSYGEELRLLRMYPFGLGAGGWPTFWYRRFARVAHVSFCLGASACPLLTCSFIQSYIKNMSMRVYILCLSLCAQLVFLNGCTCVLR
jgi:hypothetical protein